MKKTCQVCKVETKRKVKCPKCGNRLNTVVCTEYKKEIRIRKIPKWSNAKVQFSSIGFGVRKEYINLCTPEIVDNITMYTALHEIGHIALGHQNWNRARSKNRKILAEVDAWLYALKCVKEPYKVELIGFAMRCIKTYISRMKYHLYNFMIIRNILLEQKPVEKKIHLFHRRKDHEFLEQMTKKYDLRWK